MSSFISEEEKPIYDRIVTIVNYHFGNRHNVISLQQVAWSYTETYGADIEKDFKELGYPSLTTFLRHLNFTITPHGMLSTRINQSNENGVRGVIKLMQRTTSRFGGSRIDNMMQQTPITYVSPTEVEKPLGPPPVPRRRRVLSIEKPPEKVKSKSKKKADCASPTVEQDKVLKILTKQSDSETSSTEIIERPEFIVKAVLYDGKREQWKIALQRDEVKGDMKFFKFCYGIHNLMEAFENISKRSLIPGKCYFVLLKAKYYRAVFISHSQDNMHGLFEFADYEVMRPVPYKFVRVIPNRPEMDVPYMVTWVYANDCDVKPGDNVYAKLSNPCGHRKVYFAELEKIRMP